MLKTWITLLFLLPVQLLWSQQFNYPAFPSTIKNVNDLLLPGWILKDSTTGDLNGDKMRDFATVVEYKDTIDEVRPDSMINRGSPRILLICFYDKKSAKYNLVLQHNTFITRYGEGGMVQDAYDKISIANNVLKISLEFVRGHTGYIFRYQQNDFYLIGATNAGVSAGEFDSWDINFSTKKAKHSWGSISDEKLKEKWQTISIPNLKKLKELTMPFEWEALPDVYL